MGRAMSGALGKFQPGDRVRVRTDDRPGHLRTPFYVRGKIGWVERVYGEFLNPESLGHGGDGLPRKMLYLIGFDQDIVWNQYEPSGRDKLFVDIYEHWLDPA